MLTYLKSTLGILHMLMHLSLDHMTLLPVEFHPYELSPQSDLRRRADSRWALPQIFSLFWDTAANCSACDNVIHVMCCIMYASRRVADYMGDDVNYVITEDDWDDTFDTVSSIRSFACLQWPIVHIYVFIIFNQSQSNFSSYSATLKHQL